MLIDVKHISPLLVYCAMKNKLSGHIKSFSFHNMFFQSHYGRFADFFEAFYIFAVTIDPFQTLFLAPYVLNTPC